MLHRSTKRWRVHADCQSIVFVHVDAKGAVRWDEDTLLRPIRFASGSACIFSAYAVIADPSRSSMSGDRVDFRADAVSRLEWGVLDGQVCAIRLHYQRKVPSNQHAVVWTNQ